jgi:thioredoxin 1
MSLRNTLKSLLGSPEGGPGEETCVLVPGARELEAAIASNERLMVLFYASWCPFSRAFLGIYQKYAADGGPCYVRILVDDGDPVAEKYGIDVYPTVLYFEKGRLAKRLDGAYHRGLTRGQLEDFASRCAVPGGR